MQRGSEFVAHIRQEGVFGAAGRFGAVALLLSAAPGLIGQVDQVEEIFRRTAVQLTTTEACGGVPGSQIPNNTYGWGRINVQAAVDMVRRPATETRQRRERGTLAMSPWAWRRRSNRVTWLGCLSSFGARG